MTVLGLDWLVAVGLVVALLSPSVAIAIMAGLVLRRERRVRPVLVDNVVELDLSRERRRQVARRKAGRG